MKDLTCTYYRSPDTREINEMEKPIPKDNEVPVKIRATSLNQTDWHLLTPDIFLVRRNMGLFKPKFMVLGTDIAGVVNAVGSNCKQFGPGDAVFANAFTHGYGGFAEYVSFQVLALNCSAQTGIQVHCLRVYAAAKGTSCRSRAGGPNPELPLSA
jgi:NADPH:quinone reductase-like Zn-dependent oxidoreductase